MIAGRNWASHIATLTSGRDIENGCIAIFRNRDNNPEVFRTAWIPVNES